MPANESTAAFDELIAALTEVRDSYVLSADREFSELEAVEGFRYVTQLLSEASELLIEADPERPRFSSIVSPARKFLGDNPDALYQQAVVRDDRTYRIRGRKGAQSYISFTVHGPDPAGGINGPVLADRNDRDLKIAADGSFEIILSPDEHPGNWIPLKPGAWLVLVRNYYLQERSVQTDPFEHVQLAIEPVAELPPPPPLDDATFAGRLRAGTAFLRAATLGLRQFGVPGTAPFAGRDANTVGPPFSFRGSDIDAAGAVDIFYSSGWFDLGPDEALVMDGLMPSGVFANVMLWNIHMQTLEYVHRRTSLNSSQMTLGRDGRFRVVLAPRDPGVPNWLDTAGQQRGAIFWRFLLPDVEPPMPVCRVVPVDRVGALSD